MSYMLIAVIYDQLASVSKYRLLNLSTKVSQDIGEAELKNTLQNNPTVIDNLELRGHTITGIAGAISRYTKINEVTNKPMDMLKTPLTLVAEVKYPSGKKYLLADYNGNTMETDAAGVNKFLNRFGGSNVQMTSGGKLRFIGAQPPTIKGSTGNIGATPVSQNTKKPEVVAQKPEAVTPKPEINTVKPEVNTRKPEIANKKPEVNIPKTRNAIPQPVDNNMSPFDALKGKVNFSKLNEIIPRVSPNHSRIIREYLTWRVLNENNPEFISLSIEEDLDTFEAWVKNKLGMSPNKFTQEQIVGLLNEFDMLEAIYGSELAEWIYKLTWLEIPYPRFLVINMIDRFCRDIYHSLTVLMPEQATTFKAILTAGDFDPYGKELGRYATELVKCSNPNNYDITNLFEMCVYYDMANTAFEQFVLCLGKSQNEEFFIDMFGDYFSVASENPNDKLIIAFGSVVAFSYSEFMEAYNRSNAKGLFDNIIHSGDKSIMDLKDGLCEVYNSQLHTVLKHYFDKLIQWKNKKHEQESSVNPLSNVETPVKIKSDPTGSSYKTLKRTANQDDLAWFEVLYKEFTEQIPAKKQVDIDIAKTFIGKYDKASKLSYRQKYRLTNAIAEIEKKLLKINYIIEKEEPKAGNDGTTANDNNRTQLDNSPDMKRMCDEIIDMADTPEMQAVLAEHPLALGVAQTITKNGRFSVKQEYIITKAYSFLKEQ